MNMLGQMVNGARWKRSVLLREKNMRSCRTKLAVEWLGRGSLRTALATDSHAERSAFHLLSATYRTSIGHTLSDACRVWYNEGASHAATEHSEDVMGKLNNICSFLSCLYLPLFLQGSFLELPFYI